MRACSRNLSVSISLTLVLLLLILTYLTLGPNTWRVVPSVSLNFDALSSPNHTATCVPPNAPPWSLTSVTSSVWDPSSIAAHNRELRFILADDINRYLYCHVPKVSSSVWKALFIQMRYNVTAPHGAGLIHFSNYTTNAVLSHYKPKEIVERLDTYYKFMFVRHPLERVLSTFNDKFQDGFGGDPAFVEKAKIIFKIPRKFHGSVVKMKRFISFPKFVLYIVKSWKLRYAMDRHWMPMYDLCHPCEINYDFIGRHENMYADSNYILKYILHRTDITFPLRSQLSDKDRTKWSRNNSATLEQALSQLRPNLLRDLKSVYAKDFTTFNYY